MASLNPKPAMRRPRLTMRQRIVRRLLMVVPLALLAVLAARMGWLDQAADRITFDHASWFDDTALVEHFRTVVTHNGMTDAPGRCLLFIVNGNDPPDAARFDVMEKHSGSCPPAKDAKDPLPKLFTLKVDRVDKTVQTDWGSPGTFHPMPR
ncbi:conserved hypothetical protein [Gluconacetobacter diazotrophicus PA1 5]|uniref:Uncharacterized protein n=2 Tax=Gluconacetobacter diazotrophicus TaxID=33996 RepID=A9H0G3_GLUDA|nr:hypothetical protein [Gluconacetobacter diazotrophicus]ACI52912.1 conserved hypothetical protein [Gluconacetobacter diazotrophicus PA1 5]MBB2157888.1 hypothetical protein [Gluconacetobacter diazotrophicus]TWB08943.1 hypothetical protein FBZ86_10544 [Gluconacetobacter diazotrophicus]CAP57121.1 conserved hypothetical protein [Gluconacetobacter diazotrophicus PA1 5]